MQRDVAQVLYQSSLFTSITNNIYNHTNNQVICVLETYEMQ